MSRQKALLRPIALCHFCKKKVWVIGKELKWDSSPIWSHFSRHCPLDGTIKGPLCRSGLQEWLGCLHEKNVLNYFCVCQTGSCFLMLSSHFFLSLVLHLMSRKETFIKSFRLCDPATPKELNYWLDLPFLECRVREPHFSSLNDIFWVWFYDSFYIFQPMSFFRYLLNLILLLLYVFVFWLRGMWDPSSPTRDRICTLCIGRQCFNHWTTREVPNPCC